MALNTDRARDSATQPLRAGWVALPSRGDGRQESKFQSAASTYQDSARRGLARDEFPRPVLGLRDEVSLHQVLGLGLADWRGLTLLREELVFFLLFLILAGILVPAAEEGEGPPY